MAKKKHLHDAQSECAYEITPLCPLDFVLYHDGTFPSLLSYLHLCSDVKVIKTSFSATNVIL